MVDLHCHMLPGIDDGAADLDTALAMARIAVADGITTTACTPHIYIGLYDNTGQSIQAAVAEFRGRLEESDIVLRLTYGADTHLAPDLVQGLRSGRIPGLHGSRYFLLEPPHHVAPPRLEETAFNLLAAGFIPLLTHPERLTWIAGHYPLFRRLARQGVWMQVTAGSLVGRFGPAARYWAERLLDEGLTHVLASDAHGVAKRPPILSEGRRIAERYLGAEEAAHLVVTRPQGILTDLVPSRLPTPPGLADREPAGGTGNSWLGRLFRRRRGV